MMPPYRKSNVLAMALGSNESALGAARTSLPSPRLIDLKMSELPPDIRPGDSVTVHLQGFVKSMDHEGNVVFAILNVMNENEEEGREKKIWVTPPESPTP